MDLMGLLQQSGMGNSVGGAPTPGGNPMGGMGAMSQGGLLEMLMKQFGAGSSPTPAPAPTPEMGGAAGSGAIGGGSAAGNMPGPTGPSPMMKGMGQMGSSIGKGMMAQNTPKPMTMPQGGGISPFQPPQYRPPGQMGQQAGGQPFQNPFSPIR